MQIHNIFVKLSHFPEDCKVGKLKPLLKKAETNAKNFRSISLLDTVKIYEESNIRPNCEILSQNNTLDKYHSVLRKNHSTDTSLSYLTDRILTRFGSGLLTGTMCIDLQKVFRNLNHEILLKNVPSWIYESIKKLV